MMGIIDSKMIVFNLLTGILSVVVQFAVSFFLSPFIVKNLGAEANGFTQLAANFVMYASLLTVSFNSMAGRFISVNYHRKNYESARFFFSSVYAANLTIILLFIPSSLYVVNNLPHIIDIGNSNVWDVEILFLCVFFNFFISLIISLYSISMFVRNMVFYMNLLNTVKVIFNALLLLLFFTYLPIKLYYVTFVGLLLNFILLPFYIRIHKKILPSLTFSKKNISLSSLKELFLSGIWNTVNQCGHLLNTGLDLLLANLLINPYSMGLLAVSKTIPSAIIQLATTINSNFAPSIVQIWAEGDKQKLLNNLKVSMKISSVLISVPIITFCCFGHSFYKLWQPTLESEILTMLSIVACFTFIPVAGTQTLYNVFTASNKLQFNSLTYIFTGLLNVLFVYLGVKYFRGYEIFVIVITSTFLSIIRSLFVILPYISSLLNLKWYFFYKYVMFSLLCSSINVIIALPFVFFSNNDCWTKLIINLVFVAAISLFLESLLVLNKNERGFIFKKIGVKI